MSDKVISSTTQEFLDVYDIVNDMVLLKDGTAAVILQIGTMNFSLLAEQEQDAVIFTYGSLLNSLNYPIQTNIQSQTKDATKYLRLLEEQVEKASSDRKATLIKQYRDFVATLIKERNVLQKRFYIIVPASPGEMGLITPSGVLPGKTAFNIASVEKSILLEKATNILEPRREHLTAQFNRLGLFTRQLSTQEIIQNFYINYNPEAAEGQEISSSENYTTPLVRASFGGKFMQLNNQVDQTGDTVNNQTSNQSPLVTGQTITTPVVTSTQTDQNTSTPAQATSLQETAPPISSNPSAEEILSDKPTQTIVYEEPKQAAPLVEPEIQSGANPVEPTIQPIEISVPPIEQVIEPTMETDANATETITAAPQNIESIPEQENIPQEALEQTTPQTAAQSSELDFNLDPNLINANPVKQDGGLGEGFSEDITPLQNKFETQVEEPVLNQETSSDQITKTEA